MVHLKILVKLHWTVKALLFVGLLSTVTARPSRDTTRNQNLPDAILTRIKKSPLDTNRISMLLKLGDIHYIRLNAGHKNIDSALSYYNQAFDLSKQLRSKEQEMRAKRKIGACYLYKKESSKGLSKFQDEINYYYQQKDYGKEADVWMALGHAQSNAGLSSNESFTRASMFFTRANDPAHSALALKFIADHYLQEGNVILAEQKLLIVLKQLKAINYPKLYDTYFLLASTSRIKGNLNKELFYGLETIKSMQAAHDTLDVSLFSYNLAQTYEELGMFEKSLYYFKQSLKGAKTLTSPNDSKPVQQIIHILIVQNKTSEALRFLMTFLKNNPGIAISNNYLLNQSFGDCFKAMQQNAKAERHYLEMIRIVDTYKDPTDWPEVARYQCYTVISDFYISTHQYKKADFYLIRALNFPEKLISWDLISKVNLYKSQADSALGHLSSAITHYQKHIRINDSLFSITKNKQLQEIQIKYESETKDKDILLQSQKIQLLNKQSQLQKNEVDKTIGTRNVTFAGTAMLLLLLGILYNRYRLKQKSNLQLENQKDEINAQNHALQSLVNEKEWLIREVHHRVKNNLQIVMSLLYTQSSYLKDEVALNAVMDSQHRVQAMSMIHQKLYQSENDSMIYMPEYINDLVEYLKDSYKTRSVVFFDQHIEPVNLDVVRAVPVGLIINEIITNAIKHAFPHTKEDHIRIELFVSGTEEVSLIIKDNGKGMPESFNINNDKSFGMLLIKGLTEDLGGKYSMENDNGTTIKLIFSNSPLTNISLQAVV